METIYNIARDNAVSWGTLATALDNNFNELDPAIKTALLPLLDQIDSLNSPSEVDTKISTAINPIKTELLSVKTSIPTNISLLNNDSNYISCGSHTYAELASLKLSNSLKPGAKYILTDYDCIWQASYDLDDQVYTESGEGWQLVLTAISTNEFSYNVDITYSADSAYALRGGLPILNCKYDFDGSYCEWNAPESKGCIFYLEDSNYNALDYDFKHIKFRRYSIIDITPNTTVDSKSNSTWGCYRTYITEGDLNANSDSRSWIGAGAESEKQLLNDIFSGDFRKTIWGLAAYSDTFMNLFIKPFANPNDDSRSYIGLKEELNIASWWKYENNNNANPPILQAKYTYADKSKMFYTFDLNGKDASNNIDVHHNRIESPFTNDGEKLRLTNTVILFFNEGIPIWYNTFKRCSRNTIQIIAEHYPTGAGLGNNSIEHFSLNIVSTCMWNFNKLTGVQYNLILRNYFSLVVSTSSLYGNVMFGAFSGISFKESAHNLLFGDPNKVLLKGKTEYESPADGNYWYDDVANDWFGYNILSPFLYAHFYPHTNTNTCVMPYNKGVTFLGTIQHNYFTRLCWGVKMEYGSVQGCYFNGPVLRTKFCGSCWLGQDHGEKVIETNPIPALTNCDVKAFSANRHTVIPLLTEEQKTLLAEEGAPKMWCIDGTTSKITKYITLGDEKL